VELDVTLQTPSGGTRAERRRAKNNTRTSRAADAARGGATFTETRGIGYLKPAIAGRLAAGIFLLCAVLSITHLLTNSLTQRDQVGLLITGAVSTLATVGCLLVRWDALLPRGALVVVTLAAVLVGAINTFHANPMTFGSPFIVILVWIGLVSSIRSVVLGLVPIAAAYVAPYILNGWTHQWWIGAVINVGIGVVLGVSVAWAGERLRYVESLGRRRLTGLESVLSSTVDLAEPLEPDLVVDMVVQLGSQAFHADAVLLLGAAPEPDTLMVLQTRHWGALAPGARLPFFAGLGPALLAGEPIDVPSGWIPQPPESGGESKLIPLLKPEGLVGVLVLWWRWSVNGFGTRIDRDLAMTFGRQAGSALARAYAFGALQDATMMDTLTGLGNRRAADTYLASLQVGDAVVMIDLDKFKRINDDMGHPAGDALLRELGSFLATSMREGDRVARFGGEEFVMVVRRIHPVAVEGLLERLRLLWINRNPITTFSIGAAVHVEGVTVAETLKHADEALYAAKDAGRDRVVVYGQQSAFQ
jgi:diguanylate cyclase (GGDEF)-like protein